MKSVIFTHNTRILVVNNSRCWCCLCIERFYRPSPRLVSSVDTEMTDGSDRKILAVKALEYGMLMKQYAESQLTGPYDLDAVTARYTGEIILALEAAQIKASRVSGDLADRLQDAVLLSKCFQFAVLFPPQAEMRLKGFLSFVQAVQQDLSRFEPNLELDVEAEISKGQSSSFHDLLGASFWDLMAHSILTGQLSVASALLTSRVEASGISQELQPYLESLLLLVRSYPFEAPQQSVFMRWRQDVLALLMNLHGINTAGLQDVERMTLLLAGDETETRASAQNWPEALAGLTLYTDPIFQSLASNFEIAKKVRSQINSSSALPTWEEGCEALLEDRLMAALAALQNLDLGTAVVFSEFSSEKRLLGRYRDVAHDESKSFDQSVVLKADPVAQIREDMGLEYAHELLTYDTTVHLALGMLENLGSEGARTEAEKEFPDLVTRMPETAEAAISAAALLGLPELEYKLSREAGKALWARKEYISALVALWNAGDYTKTRECAWSLFENQLVTRAPTNDSLTMSVLQNHSVAEKMHLPQALLDMLAPSALLLNVLTALDADDIPGVVFPLQRLLVSPATPKEYIPLLVALVGGAGRGSLPPQTLILLMDSLSEWDAATNETQLQGQKLTKLAASYPGWQPTLSGNENQLVRHLRKQLARAVVF